MHWKPNSIVPACACFLWSLRCFITVADKFVDSNLFLHLQFDSCDKLAPTNEPPINFIATLIKLVFNGDWRAFKARRFGYGD